MTMQWALKVKAAPVLTMSQINKLTTQVQSRLYFCSQAGPSGCSFVRRRARLVLRRVYMS